MIVVGLLADPVSASVIAIAGRAAAAGSKVEAVGVVPGSAEWDTVLFDLTAAGVGHATVVRSGRALIEPADLELALRYLPDIRCVVLVAPPPRLLPTALAGAEFASAPLVIVGRLDAEALADLETRAGSAAPMILEPPGDAPEDPDGTFAGFVAALAVRLDAGDPPDAAFRATTASLAADRA